MLVGWIGGEMMERFEHGGNIYSPSALGAWLDFSANINPLGLSPAVQKSLHEHIEKVVVYPDPHMRALISSIAEQYRIPEEQIFPGNGAAELFYLYFHVYRPKRVVLPVPSFSEYERAAYSVSSQVTYIYSNPQEDFAFPFEEVMTACPYADCVIIGNPNNPTGTLLDKERLTQLICYAHEYQTDIMIDESFLEFMTEADAYTVRDLVSCYDNLIVIQSLTKLYALPGLRLGFAIVSPQRSKEMAAHTDVWHVNILAQYAGVAALQETVYREESRRIISSEKQWLFHQLTDELGFDVVFPSVNFLLFNTRKQGITAEALRGALRDQGILIRNCEAYEGLDRYYSRIAVKLRSQNERLVKKLKDIIDNRI